MNRVLVLCLLAMILAALTGCGGSAHGPDEKYILVTANVKLPYWQQAFAGLSRAAAQLQVKAEMVGPDTYDPKEQAAQLRDALKKRPTGVLVSASDPNLLRSEIDSAIAAGIPVITIDSDVPASKRLMFVGTDNYKAGVMGAQVAVKQLQGKGNVVVFTMPGQPNLADRLRGYKDVFAASPQIRIAEVVDIKGDARIAFDRTMEMIEKGAKVDAFVCLEAIACPEVAEVLDRKHVAGKTVVAMDTDQRTLEGIQKGLISATIGQRPFTMAFTGLKLLDDLHHRPLAPLAKDWSQDSFSPIPSFVDTGATLIDKSNVDVFIQARNTATSNP